MNREAALRTETHHGFKFEIFSDPEPENPREWCNIGTMICFHRRYTLGDKTDLTSTGFNSWDQLETYLEKNLKAVICLPIYMYDHSGITVSTSPFSCPWDSGQIGFIYVTKETIKKQTTYRKSKKHYTDIKRISKKQLNYVKDMLENEVKTYDQYLRGDVYSYTITDPTGQIVDSANGYFGEKECIINVKKFISWMIRHNKKEKKLARSTSKQNSNQINIGEETI